jgi:non-specific serine/threonine protein kinase
VRSLAQEVRAADGIKRRGVVLAYLQRFKQICNHPSQWSGDGAWDEDGSGKFVRLRALCESLVARQERVLVFTQFRELTRPLAAFLEGVFGEPGFRLDGRTPVRRRQQLVDEFAAEDGPPFFVISLKAGGTGLNLTAASQVIHFDRWWNPAVENQATDRAYRIGQHRNVLVHKLVCRGTLEEKIDAMIRDKQALADDVLAQDGGAGLTEMSNEELMRTVQLDLRRAVDGA